VQRRALELTCIVAAFGCGLCVAVVPCVRLILFKVGQPAFHAQLSENFEIQDLCFVSQSTYVRRAALYVTADCPVSQPCISHVVDA
jgi:hypothetical protein